MARISKETLRSGDFIALSAANIRSEKHRLIINGKELRFIPSEANFIFGEKKMTPAQVFAEIGCMGEVEVEEIMED